MSNVIRNHFDPCHYDANGTRVLIKMTYFQKKKEMTPYYNKRHLRT